MIKDFSIEPLSTTNIGLLMDFLSANAKLKVEHFYPHPFTLDYFIYLLLKKTKDYYCMAIIDGKVVAYGLLRGWDEGYEIPSLGVAVDRDFRHRGLGRFLCTYLHMVARLRGATKIRLRVHVDNTNARSLYNSLGYVFSDTPVNDLYEGFLDV